MKDQDDSRGMWPLIASNLEALGGLYRSESTVETVLTVDAHTAGEPLRVVLAGYPTPKGNTILERRAYARENLDRYRTALMWEPRGHADMYGCLIVPPEREDSDMGVLFLHNDGYSTMCGHGIIAVTKVLFERGICNAETSTPTLKIDAPAGQILATAKYESGKIKSVSFVNVPSYVEYLDEELDIPGIGRVQFDIAFGGAYYVYLDAGQLNLEVGRQDLDRIIHVGRIIKQVVGAEYDLHHPENPEMNFIYGTIFTSPPGNPENHSRNVCVFADGEVDRSPTGTGVSGRIAIEHRRGLISRGEVITIESILGTEFTVEIVETSTFGSHAAVIPRVSGNAHVTGMHSFSIDPADPLADGFLLR